MNRTCVDSAILELYRLTNNSRLTSSMKYQVQIIVLDLEFLKLYIWCLEKGNEALIGEKKHAASVKKSHIETTLGSSTVGLYSTGMSSFHMGEFEDWDSQVSQLEDRIHQCKPKIKQDCVDLLECSFKCMFTSNELSQLMSCLSFSLEDLGRLRADSIFDVKMQIESIKEKLDLFSMIFMHQLQQMWKGESNMYDSNFKIRIQDWTYKAACLSLLYWAHDEKEDKMAHGMSNFLFDLQRTIKPSTQEDTMMYLTGLIGFLKSSYDRLLTDELVPKFVDFLLEILQLVPLRDRVENFRRGLIILVTFLGDPPMAKEYKRDVKLLFNKVQHLICSLTPDLGDGGVLLHEFLEALNMVKSEVSELYTQIFLNSLPFNFPKTNILGFIDSLLEHLKETTTLLENHQVENVQEELLSLRPFLDDMLKQQNEDLWARIVYVAYQCQIAINLLLCFKNYGWDDMSCLSYAAAEIKLIHSEIKKIQNEDICKIKVPMAEMSSNPIPASVANMKIMDQVIVGFEDELETIVNRLTRGSEELDIVSIVGMPGLGKTTLAKRVYDSPLIRLHFNKCAWCSVSQTYQSKKLLINILSDVATLKDDISKKEKEELAEQLYKCLRGQRYLIVMDDIWDVGAWEALKESFPDDNKGSRIMFTSRIHNVAVQAKFDCNPHPLRLFSHKECWKLLKKKLFGNGYCPWNLKEVGKQIARNCKGLPLVAVVIAGLLSYNVNDLNWWKRTAESLASLKVSEALTNILELSYVHLPESLKSCFLYFGAFQEDRVIRVQKLTQLWISEGFIPKSEVKSLEDVAKDYLMDLVAVSLVTVTSRSSNGSVKECRLHDLLHEFCLEKGKEENFLKVDSTNFDHSSSTGAVYRHFRICFQTNCDRFFASYPSGPCVHSLLCVPDGTSPEYDVKFFSFSNFKLLHVLDLENIKLDGEFPDEIVVLVLLRYLAISCSVVLSIPPSISNLKHLETFCIRRDFGYEPTIIPSTIWTMKKLRHLDVGRFSLSFSGDCGPEESFQLDNVRTFSSPSLSYGELAAKLLRRLPAVRKLKCQFLEFWDSHYGCNQFPVLEFLSQLESLNVLYTGKVLYPCAICFPSTLKKLTLTDFNLPWTEISTIGKLPNLEVLKLLRNAFYGEKWDLEDEEFENLKFLKLSELNIKHWNASDYPFPCLQQLILESCFKLEEIPSSFGDISALKAIHVLRCGCKVQSSVWEIEKQQQDMGNENLEVVIRN